MDFFFGKYGEKCWNIILIWFVVYIFYIYLLNFDVFFNVFNVIMKKFILIINIIYNSIYEYNILN